MEFDEYTPLNTIREDILKEVHHTRLMQFPPTEPPNLAADKSKRCNFHRNQGLHKLKKLSREAYPSRILGTICSQEKYERTKKRVKPTIWRR